MTLKQSDSETDHFAVDMLVNPDDMLPPVLKLEKYANSEIVFNRQIVARNLLETLRLVQGNQEDVHRVFNVFTAISDDFDASVRTELMVQLPHIAAFCKEASSRNQYLKEASLKSQYLLPMLMNYLGDENNQVRKSSHTTLLSLIEQGLLDIDTVNETICGLVIHLTDSVHPEDLRTESIVLMSKLAVLLGKKSAEELFLDRLFTLCVDKSNNIRKACASTFGDFCTTVGMETTEELLLPKFFSLCEDTAWCVRKACAENFMPVSCVVSRETRCKLLSNFYLALLSDQSRWVRLTAYQALGPFISTFAEPEKTGLYYSKDGVLTVVDIPDVPEVTSVQSDIVTNDSECSSKCEDAEKMNCNGNSSSLDRTNSTETCDSVVPLNSTETNLSASEIPGISCHVGNNYRTVIEVSSSTMTLPPTASKDNNNETIAQEKVSELPKENGSCCDSKYVVSKTVGSGDDSSVESTTVVNQKYCHTLEERERHLREYPFTRLWYEVLFGRDDEVTVVNGKVIRKVNGDTAIREKKNLDNSIVQNSVNSEVESALLSSITVNGISISSSVALAGPMNCEVIPLVTCSTSAVESKNQSNKAFPLNKADHEDNEAQLSETQHSIATCPHDQDLYSNSVSKLTFNDLFQEPDSVQESDFVQEPDSVQGPDFAADDSILNTNNSVELKFDNGETSQDESAFNNFQYWRTPLPEIDVDSVYEDLDASFGTMKYSFKSSSVMEDKSEQFSSWDKFTMNSSFVQTLNVCSGSLHMRDAGVCTKADDLTSENKEGEPPPGSKHISVHEQDIVPPELLLSYLKMIDAAWAQTIDAEIARHCAYSLPAVALTLGRKYWPCLKETFDALSSDLQGFIMMWKVRRTVASSMHQLAVILGPEITSRDLLPVFSRFISDLDEVRVGILQHMSEFLKVLQPEERREFLPSLPEFLVSNSDTETNEKNWRFRLILAEQLVSVADLYEPQDVRDYLVPLSLNLIRDKICEVRLAAVRVMAAVMRRMSQSPTPDLTKAVLTELTDEFIHAPKWLHRQLYVYICQEFIVENSLPPDQFAEDALPQLLYLCWDSVPNVRIAIARCLAVVIWPLDTFSNPNSPHRELLLQTIHTLQGDLDADVRFYANMVSTHECSCLQHGEFSNLGELPV